jgi:RHS repeat-associated protein
MAETGPTGEVESSGGWEDSLIWQYTAFGEPIFPWPDEQRATEAGRYKYDGLYGYEARPLHMWGANINLPPIQLLHVGERWYQPGTGRFVQRDPIGTRGGTNVYGYCANSPLAHVDASGEGIRSFLRKAVLWVWEQSVTLFGPKKMPPYREPCAKVEYYWDWWDFLDLLAPPVLIDPPEDIMMRIWREERERRGLVDPIGPLRI